MYRGKVLIKNTMTGRFYRTKGKIEALFENGFIFYLNSLIVS